MINPFANSGYYEPVRNIPNLLLVKNENCLFLNAGKLYYCSMRRNLFFLVLSIVFLIRCADNEEMRIQTDHATPEKQLKQSSSDEGEFSDKELNQAIPEIRENVKRINTISHWTRIDYKDVWETTEGGEAHFYYHGNQLEKISIRQFGEMFQQSGEYYLKNGHLSFVFERVLRYNRPIYYDSSAMKENGDTVVFDIEKSVIEEKRSYFKKEKLIHQTKEQNGISSDRESEQKRIVSDFDLLKRLGKKK